MFIRDFPYMDWKELRLVATINSLPHFDWKHAVLALTPEYQVYSIEISLYNRVCANKLFLKIDPVKYQKRFGILVPTVLYV